jgi:hypothetical protein
MVSGGETCLTATDDHGFKAPVLPVYSCSFGILKAMVFVHYCLLVVVVDERLGRPRSVY